MCAVNSKPPQLGSTLSREKPQGHSGSNIAMVAKGTLPKVHPIPFSQKDNTEIDARKTPMYNGIEHNMNHIVPHDEEKTPSSSNTPKKTIQTHKECFGIQHLNHTNLTQGRDY